jgi:hypothetical protein
VTGGRFHEARAYRACQLPLARFLAQNLVPKIGTRPIFTLVPIFWHKGTKP